MEQSPTIGLVLSGGGSKGAYQAGVYKAMEEKGLLPRIPPPREPVHYQQAARSLLFQKHPKFIYLLLTQIF